MSNGQSGARFVDKHKQDRGWAIKVVRRERAIGRLVILDVTTTDRGLSDFLGALDKSPLLIQQTDVHGASYNFAWASGYQNGTTTRVQGILQDA
jgi:hypothetical protein